MRVRKQYEHITPILYTLHWLPVHLRIEFNIVFDIHRCLHNAASSYLTKLPKQHASARTWSGKLHHLHPRTWLTLGDRAAAPRLLN